MMNSEKLKQLLGVHFDQSVTAAEKEVGAADSSDSVGNSGILKSGKLVARVETAQAKGVTVRTPTLEVVDLGI